jgi:hypothetical protein
MGASAFIAIAIIADIIEAGRLKDSKRFTSYLRPAPRAANSNTTVKNRGANKMGRKLSAPLLPQSLNHAMNASGKLRGWHERLCEHKKPGLARTGLRRRALAEICQTLKKGECHYGRDEHNHKTKMTQYRRFFEKQKNAEISQKIA